MFTMLDEEKARRFWEEELRQEGRAEGRAEGGLDMLIGLVKKNLISVADAAKESGMTVADFSRKTGIPIQQG